MEQDYSQMSVEKRIYGGELLEKVLTGLTESNEHRQERMRKSLNAHFKNFWRKENGE